MTLQVLVPTPLSAADVAVIVAQAVVPLGSPAQAAALADLAAAVAGLTEATVIVVPLQGAPTPVLTPTLQVAAQLRGVVAPPGRLTAVPPAPSRLGGSA